MKKFIAGVVMTGLMFMALATGAVAKSSNGGGQNKQEQGNGYKSYKCNAYDYYGTSDYSCS